MLNSPCWSNSRQGCRFRSAELRVHGQRGLGRKVKYWEHKSATFTVITSEASEHLAIGYELHHLHPTYEGIGYLDHKLWIPTMESGTGRSRSATWLVVGSQQPLFEKNLRPAQTESGAYKIITIITARLGWHPQIPNMYWNIPFLPQPYLDRQLPGSVWLWPRSSYQTLELKTKMEQKKIVPWSSLVYCMVSMPSKWVGASFIVNYWS